MDGPAALPPTVYDTRTGESVPAEALRRLVRAGPGDSVVLAGTLVEGIGNPLSDFDLIVLCTAHPTARRFRDGPRHRMYGFGQGRMNMSQMLRFGSRFDAVPDEATVTNTFDVVSRSGTQCDVEYICTDDFAALCDRLGQTAARLRQTYGRAGAGMGEDELKLLHRVLTGHLLQEGPGLAALRDRLSAADLRYVLARASLPSWSSVVDLIGFYRSGAEIECRDLAATYLHNISAAYAHLLGFTNPSRKWTYRFLSRSGDAMAGRLARFAEEMWCAPPPLADLVAGLSDVTDAACRAMHERCCLDPDLPDPETERRALKTDSEASGLSDRPFLLATEFLKRHCCPEALPLAQFFDPGAFDGTTPLPDSLGRIG